MSYQWLEAKRRTSFAQFDGKRVSAILKQGGREFVCVGVAHFQRDDRLGNILRIDPTDPQPGSPQLILTESEWKGRIIPDLHYGALYCFIPASDQNDDVDSNRKTL